MQACCTPCGRPRPLFGAASLALLLWAGPAIAQLSPTSWWPKFQRDARNSGYTPQLGFAADVHVVWSLRLGDPVPVSPGENHATPVFSPDNARLYVGGPASKLTAVNVASGSAAWSLTLGDGSGTIFQTAAVAADGSIYVGAWDNQTPYDGFSKVRDEGTQGVIVWTAPMRRLLASPTITDSGLIIVGGQHATEGWGYFALRDLGTSYSIEWVAAQLADPGNPASTGAIGASPALSPDGIWVFGGSYENRTFWQIDAQSGAEAARLPLDWYCYAAGPVVSDDGFPFVGEGMSFTNPSDPTQGKLYVFEPDAQGVMGMWAAVPLYAGHLNGGTAAVRQRADGQLRLFVPANGYGKPGAKLIALGFDPLAQPPLTKLWEAALGGSAWAYPQAVVLRDELIYVLGPSDQHLYGVRDAGAQGSMLWTIALAEITRAAGWQPAGQRGPQGVIVGPDGTLYWNAVDGYLYALRGWLTGDLDADGELTADDLDWLLTILGDPGQYELQFPEIDTGTIADVNGDGHVDLFDVSRMVELLEG